MEWILGPLPLLAALSITALVFNAPIMLIVRLARNRLGSLPGRLALAAGFAATTAYMLWRLEWEDVWRHGIPSPDLLLFYALYIGALAAAGWFLGRLIAPQRQHRPAEAGRHRGLA